MKCSADGKEDWHLGRGLERGPFSVHHSLQKPRLVMSRLSHHSGELLCPKDTMAHRS